MDNKQELFQVLVFGMCQYIFSYEYDTRYDSRTNITSVYLMGNDLFSALDEINRYYRKHLMEFKREHCEILLIMDESHEAVLLQSDWIK